MKVLAPNYSGSLSFYTRSHTDGLDYLLILVNEETKKAYVFKIASSGITETDYQTTFSKTLPIEENTFYKYQIFTQDGTISNSVTTEQDVYQFVYDNYITGKIYTEITSGKIYCTTQTDLERYKVQEGQFQSEQSDNDFIVYD